MSPGEPHPSRQDRQGTETEDAGAPAAREANRKACALFDACRAAGGPRGARDAALVSVLFGANVPAEAAVGLAVGAWDPDTGVLEAESAGALRAREGAREALDVWLDARGPQPGPLFCPVGDDGSIRLRALSPEEAERAMAARAREADIVPYSSSDLVELYVSPWWEDVGG